MDSRLAWQKVVRGKSSLSADLCRRVARPGIWFWLVQSVDALIAAILLYFCFNDGCSQQYRQLITITRSEAALSKVRIDPG
jgi:hypothetical protein